MSDQFDPAAIFAALHEGNVEFVVIGGLAASVQDVGWPTFDVDIVVDVSESNLRKLAEVLEKIRAAYGPIRRSQPIHPTPEKLIALSGPQLFDTMFGRLDVLKEAGGETFETLTQDAATLVHEGQSIRCASLPALLRMKIAAGRPKDLKVVPQITRAIEERENEQ